MAGVAARLRKDTAALAAVFSTSGGGAAAVNKAGFRALAANGRLRRGRGEPRASARAATAPTGAAARACVLLLLLAPLLGGAVGFGFYTVMLAAERRWADREHEQLAAAAAGVAARLREDTAALAVVFGAAAAVTEASFRALAAYDTWRSRPCSAPPAAPPPLTPKPASARSLRTTPPAPDQHALTELHEHKASCERTRGRRRSVALAAERRWADREHEQLAAAAAGVAARLREDTAALAAVLGAAAAVTEASFRALAAYDTSGAGPARTD
ncbi:hypothetical protein DIPPA_09159 [Diplonema papillatum]|nr:hypothetical protein DIPPA_09159 [Diplonema papillatum]